MSEKRIEHSGVLGMRWGVRRSAHQTKVDARTKEKISEVASRRADRSRQKLLSDEIKNRRRTGEAERFAGHVKQTSAMFKRLDTLEKKKYAEIDAEKISKISKIAKKWKVWNDIGNKAIETNLKMEENYSAREKRIGRERHKKLVAKENEILSRWANDVDAGYAKCNKLRFPNNIKTALKMDKDLSKKYTDELLNAALEVEKEVNTLK